MLNEFYFQNKDKIHHFVFFYLILVSIIFISSFIGRDFDSGTTSMFILDIGMLIIILCLIGLMIYTSKNHLLLKDRVIALIGFILVHYLTIVSINFINPFERSISSYQFQQGQISTLILDFILLLITLPIAVYLKPRITYKTAKKNQS